MVEVSVFVGMIEVGSRGRWDRMNVRLGLSSRSHEILTRSDEVVTSIAFADHMGGFIGSEMVGFVAPLGEPSISDVFGPSIDTHALEVLGDPASVVPACILL